jgi:hypothetical protein
VAKTTLDSAIPHAAVRSDRHKNKPALSAGA